MSNTSHYHLWIYGRDEMHDPDFIKDLIGLGITPSRANAITKVAYCLGLCILTKGTLEEMEDLHEGGFDRLVMDFRLHQLQAIGEWLDGCCQRAFE